MHSCKTLIQAEAGMARMDPVSLVLINWLTIVASVVVYLSQYLTMSASFSGASHFQELQQPEEPPDEVGHVSIGMGKFYHSTLLHAVSLI